MRSSREIVFSVSSLIALSINCSTKRVASSSKEAERAELKERNNEEITIIAKMKERWMTILISFV